MGDVYRARDTRLGRDVAVKVIAPAVMQDPHRQRRFQQEARAVAALNHPNVCQIYDVGEDYLVLELVEGEELRGPCSPREVVDMSLQIAAALEAAHEHGVLHRDLKPSNVLVTRTGIAKLLDFGIAKVETAEREVTLTAQGAVVGTVAYMSPEQAQGQPVDARSDIFSFGAVLYELLTGRIAFQGNTVAEVFSALLRDEPRPFDAPPALERIVRRCLQKDRALRFQTMAELKAALAAVEFAAKTPSIAVLPFANMSGDKDNEYFSDGLADDIINALAKLPDLKVIARTSSFAFKGRNEDIRRIAEMLGVTTILEGSVRRAGNRLRVTAQLITAADGSHLWSERYDRELTDVFEIQDYIAAEIARALEVTLAPPRARRRTPRLPAFEAFLRGRHTLLRNTPASHVQAEAYFKQAIALDSEYPDPRVHLGLSYLLHAMLGERPLLAAAPLIREQAKAALALDPSDSTPHFLLGSMAAAENYAWQEAREHFELAMAANVSAEAHWAYASLYFQPLGLSREAAEQMEHAVERDPMAPLWRAIHGSHLVHAGLYERAAEQTRAALKMDPTSFHAYTILGENFVMQRRWDEALESLEQAYRLFPGLAFNTGCFAGVLARLGDKPRAEQVIGAMGDTPRAHLGRALYHAILDETDDAAACFERAVEHRDPFALVFLATPLLRPLRQTARWARIARTMNLPFDLHGG
jgi:serine/threonine-protein kinase